MWPRPGEKGGGGKRREGRGQGRGGLRGRGLQESGFSFEERPDLSPGSSFPKGKGRP